MRNKLKKTILTSFSSFFPQSTSGRFLMVRAIYPALGIIFAVVIFTTYLVVDDFVKATKAKASNTSPSPYLAFFDKSKKGAVLPNSKQLAQILGESDVKAADESQIIFNLNALFKAPAVFEEDITAPNIVYNITAGPGITISGNPQTPVISVNGATSGGVLSVQGLTGAVSLVEGDGIDIIQDGNNITIKNTITQPTVTQISEKDIESYIFDSNNTGTLSSGTLALDELGYTGKLPASSLNLRTNGGLEVVNDQLSLLSTCGNGQILKWNSAGAGSWECSADTGASSSVVNVQNDGTDVGSSVNTLNFVNNFTVGTNPGIPTIAQIDIKDNSLNFNKLADVLTLDATTRIEDGTYQYITFNTANGNVGVGTTNPQYKLDVGGIIQTTGGLRVNGDTITDFTGTGLIVNAGSLNLDIVNSNVATGSTSSYSGLEFIGNQLTLLRGCNDGEGLFWNSSTNKWECLLPTGVGGVGDITKVGDITSGEAFSVANPGGALYFRNDSFLGLGSTSARITFTDASTDSISLLDAYVGIGKTNPSYHLDVGGSLNTISLFLNGVPVTATANNINLLAGITNPLLHEGNIASSAVTSVTGGIGLTGNTGPGAVTLEVGLGAGLTGNDNQIALNLAAGGTTTTTSSTSGLEFNSSGAVRVIGGCASGQVLKWNSTNSSWECGNDSGATSAIINVKEVGVTVGNSVDTLNFLGDFELTEAGGGSQIDIAIKDDALDFTEFKDALTLDANTSINFASGTGNYDLRFYNSNLNREIMYISQTGLVGMGNTNPGYTLDVGGSLNTTDLYLNGVQITASAANINLLSGLTNPLLNEFTNFGGDVTGFYNNLQLGATTVGSSELVDTGITATIYGNALSGTTGYYPTFTVDADGRLTQASTVPFTFENPLTFGDGLTRATNTITINAGLGLTLNGGAVQINLANGNTTTTTSTVSGLEMTVEGLRMIGGCSSNQLLSWNGSTWNCSSISSLGGVLGSGTDNYLARWNGTGALGKSIIYEADGGEVGIGSTSLNDTFEVAGNVTIGSGYAGINTSAPSNGLLVEGFVGIGSTNPSSLLSVGSGNGFMVDASGVMTAITGNLTNLYIGGTQLTANAASLNLLTGISNPLLTNATNFSGDVSGLYNNLQLGATTVGQAELVDTGITAANYGGILSGTTGYYPIFTVDADGRMTAASTVPFTFENPLSFINGLSRTGNSIGISTGVGITVSGGNVQVNLATGGTTTTTSSASGLEATSAGLRIIGGCASGQILSWNGSTWGCNTVSGLGSTQIGSDTTPNYLTKWTGAGTITSSAVYESASKIGIGTTAPGYTLDIGGSLNTQNLFLGGSQVTASAANLNLLAGVTNPLLTSYSAFGGDVTGFYNNLQLGTTTVGASELVDTGVTAGSYGSVSGTAAYIPTLTVDADGRLTAAGTLPFTLNFESPLTFGNGLTRAGNNIALGGTLTSNTRFMSSGTEIFYMATTGNVGIGTTNPLYRLDVNGTVNLTSLYIGGSQVTASAANLNLLTGVTNPLLNIYSAFGGDVTGFYNNLQLGATTVGASELVDTGITNGTYGNALSGTSGFYPVFTVDADGRLTAASTVPFTFENPLTFGNGVARVGNNVSVTTGVGLTTSSGAIQLNLATGGTTTTTSSVSGLEATAAGLRIIGGCASGQILSWNGSTWVCNSVAGIGSATMGADTTPNYLTKWSGGGSITSSVVYESAGKVGIGTTAPGYTLDIGGSLNTTGLYIGGSQVTASALSLNLLTGVTNPLLNIYSTFGGDVTGFYNNLQLGTTTVGATELVDTGVTAASYGAILSGTTGFYPRFTVDSDGRLTDASTVVFTYENPLTFGNGLTRSGNNIALGGTLTSNTRFMSAGTEILYITTTGNMGLGTTNPQFKLDVNGSANVTNLYIGGSQVTATAQNLNLLTGITNPLLTIYSAFGGDVTGFYNNLQLGATTVGATELVDTGVTAGSYGSVSGTAAYFPTLTVDADGRLTAAGTLPFTLNFESPLTFGNGLTRAGNNIALGGTLTSNTRFMSSGTEIFYMATTGNVGIGTTNPLYRLDVNGTVNLTTLYIGGSQVTATAQNLNLLTGMTNPLLHAFTAFGGDVSGFYNNLQLGATTVGASELVDTGVTAASYGNALSGTSGFYPVFTVDADGRLTAASTVPFTFENPLTFGNGVTRSGNSISVSTGVGLTTSGGNVQVNLATGGTTTTTSSVSGLEATSAGLRLLGGCTSSQLLSWNGSTWGCSSLTALSGVLYSGDTAANYLTKWTGAGTITSSAVYESAGKVGIGTTNPGYTLDIGGSLNTTGLYIGGSQVTASALSLNLLTGVTNPLLTIYTNFGGDVTGFYNNLQLGATTVGSSELVDTGVTAASYGAILSGTSGFYPRFTVDADGRLTDASTVVFTYENPLTFGNGLTRTTNSIALGGTLTSNTRFMSAGTEILYITTTGNMGLGTTNPQFKLDVNGSANVTNLYIGGSQVTASSANLNLLTGLTNPVLHSYTAFGGDVTGFYNDLQIGATTIGSTELVDTGVTAGSYGSVSGTAAYFPTLTVDADGRLTAAGTLPFTLNFESPLTFGNGLTRTGNNIALGGTLTSNTRFMSSGTEIFYMATTGNVGIGTTNPLYRLDVNGTVNLTSLYIGGSQVTASAQNLNLLTGLTNPLLHAFTAFGGDVTGTYNNLQIGATTVGASELVDTGVTAATYGSVLSGTSGFYPVFTVDADGRLTAASTVPFTFENPLTFGNGVARVGNSVSVTTGVGLTTSSGAVQLNLATGGTTTTTSSVSGLEATSAGLRLLGGCTSSQLLSWNGSTWGCSSLTSLSGVLYSGNTAANFLTKWTGAGTITSSAVYESAGKVGIGTTAPGYTLDIGGSLNTTGLYIGGSQVTASALSLNLLTGVTNPLLNIYSTFGGDVTGFYNNLQLGATTVGASELVDTGVTAASYGAILSGTTGFYPRFTVDSDGRLTDASTVVFSYENPLTFGNGLTRTTNNVALGGTLTSNTRFMSSGTEILYITTTGNVGIGTTNPQFKLDVNGSANVTNLYIGGSQVTASAANLNLLAGVTNPLLNIYSAFGGDVTGFYNNLQLGATTVGATELVDTGVTAASYGNVLSGTTGFYPRFTVDADGRLTQASTVPFIFENPLTFGNGLTRSGNNIALGGTLTSNTRFMSSGTEIFYMATTGNVGIGTTNPLYRLDVNGTVNLTSLYIGGTQVTATAQNLNLLTGMTNPLLHAFTAFGGDVTGFYNNLQLGATTVGASELVDTGVTAASYGNALSGTTGFYPVFSVDADGRLTQASTVPFSFENPLAFNGGLTRTGNTVGVNTGVGLTTVGGSLQVNLSTGGTTTTTSSASGLEVSSNGLRLIGGCAQGDVMKWNSTSKAWECATDTGAAYAIINVKEVGSTVGSNVDTLNFLGDFELTEAGGGTQIDIAIKDDALDFTEFKDALTLDANTSINLALGATDNSFRFYNSNINKEVLFLSTTGNVGIGTTNPGYTLDVGGSLNTSGLYLDGVQVTASAANLNLLTGVTNPLLNTYTSFGGDVTGFYNNLQIGATTVGASELVDTGVTAASYGSILSGTSGFYPRFTVDADGRLTQASTVPFTFENPLTFGNGLTRTGNTVTVNTGLGLTLTGGAVQVNLATGGTTTTISSVSGLESTSSGLRFIGGCSDQNVLAWNAGTGQWTCTDLTGGVGGLGDITKVGSMSSGDAFAGLDADNQWLGLGSTSGRIEFDHQAKDEINFLDAYVGIGTTAPQASLDIQPDNAAALNIRSFGTNPGDAGELRFSELSSNGSNYTGFRAPDNLAQNIIYTLPSDTAAANQVLINDGSGNLSWATLTGGSLGVGTITQVGNITTGQAFTAGAPGSNLYIGNTGWMGLSGSAGRIEYHDLSTDQIRFLGGNVGIGTTNATSLLTVGSSNLFTVDNTGALTAVTVNLSNLYIGGSQVTASALSLNLLTGVTNPLLNTYTSFGGDVTGFYNNLQLGATTVGASELVDTGVTAASYGSILSGTSGFYPRFTVDADGRLTTASTVPFTFENPLTFGNGVTRSGNSISVSTGVGLTTTGGNVQVNLATGGTTTTTTSVSGLEATSAGLRLLGGCASGQILSWNGSAWICNSTSALGSAQIGSDTTPNYLTKWTGAGVISSSAVYETGGKVGIGLTNPGYTLDIGGTLNTRNLYLGGSQVTASAQNLNLLTGITNPLLNTYTSFGGDVTGFYNNLQLGATTVGASELVDTGVTAATYGTILSGTSGFYPVFTVDADGRLTAASTVPFTFENPLTFGNGVTRSGNSISVATGVGLTVTGGNVQVNLATGGTTTTTSSASGLEATTAGLRLLGGCLSGQVMSWNGSQWTCNTIGGLGSTQIGADTTPNYLTKWTGAGVISSSAVYESAGKVGIGTTAPGYNLDVHGTANFTNLFLGDTQVTALALNLNLLTGVTNPLLTSYSAFGGDVTGFYNNLQLGATTVGSSELIDTGVTAASYGNALSGTTGFYPRFTVDADGRLTQASTVPFTFENPLTFGNGVTRSGNSISVSTGVGLTTTGGNVQVNLATGGTTTTTTSVSGLEATSAGLRLLGGCASGQILSWNGSSWACNTVAGLGSAQIGADTTPNYLTKWTGAGVISSSAVYESAGKVGIGTTAPGYTLDIGGSLNTTGLYIGGSQVTASALSLNLLTGVTNPLLNTYTSFGGDVTGFYNNLQLGATTVGASELVDTGVTAASYGGILSGTTGFYPRFTVDADGRLTQASTVPFSFENPLTFGNGLTRTTNSIALGGTLTSNTRFMSAGTEIFYMMTTGNVGIGTTNPLYRLDVNGTVNLTTLYIGGTQVTANAASLNLLTGVTNPLLTSYSAFGGDVTGFYNNLQIGATTVGASELVDTGVTAASYGNALSGTTGFYPIFSVDADGRLTQASTVPFTFENPLTFGNGVTRSGNSISVSTGVGLTTTGGNVQVNLATGGTTTTTTSVSGLEATSAGLRLLGGCGVGQIMSWDGASWKCNSVTGIGSAQIGSDTTPNYLTKWTGAGVISSSAVYESAGKVGIGTTAPGYTLDIGGSLNTTGLYIGGSQVTASALSLNLLTGVTNPLLNTYTSFGGDVTGFYNNLQIGVTTVGASELVDTGVTAASYGSILSGTTGFYPRFTVDADGRLTQASTVPFTFENPLTFGNGVTRSGNSISVATGLGLTTTGGNVQVNLATGGTTTTTTSVSGLEATSAGLRLLGGCASGQIMSWDGSSWKCNSLVGVGSALIGADTTPNYLTKWTGAGVISSSAIYESAGKVGIGTTAPGYNLDVHGTANFTNLFLGDTQVTALAVNLNLLTGVTNPLLTTFTSFAGDVSGLYNNLQLGATTVGSSELIDTGVTAASYGSILSGTTGFYPRFTVDADGRLTQASTVPFTFENPLTFGNGLTRTTNSIALGGTLTANTRFMSAGTEIFYMMTTGNVGIGTTNPLYRLDVNGTVNLTSLYIGGSQVTANAASLNLLTGVTNPLLTSFSSFGGDVTGFYNNLQLGATTVGASELAETGITATTYGNALSGTTGFYPRFTVDADGRLTQASTIPFNFENPLTFGNGLSRSTNSISVATGVGLTTTGGNVQVNLAIGGTTTTTTSVSGLEATSAGLRLLGGCVSGQILSWNGSSWGCNTLGGLGSAQIGADTTPNFLTKWVGVGSITSSAIYESAGKVGIGTTAPGYTLDIGGSLNTTGLYIGGSQVTASALSLNLLTGVTNPLLNTYTSFGGDVTGFYNNLQLGATTVGSSELVDTGVTAASYGSILSGTTGFYPRFTVDADGRLTAASTVPFSYENPLTFGNGLTRTTNSIALGGTLTGDTRFTSSGSEVFFIGANGKVGIGVTSPSTYSLDVAGNIRAGTDLYIGSIGLGSTGGAALIGVNTASFAVSTAPTVQAQLSALNAAIGDRNFSNNYLSDTSTLTSAFSTLDTQLYNLSIGVSGMWRDTNGATAGGTAYLNDLTSAMAIGGTGAGSPFYFAPTSGLTINNGTNTLFNLNTTLGSTTDLLSLNIPSGTTIGNIFAIYDNGSPVFKVSQSQIESAVPHTFTAAGDVSIAYDLVFTNATSANIDFRNNGTIRTVSPSENLDLTLSAANSGVVYIDDSMLVAGSNIIGGTYVGLGITAPVNGLLVEGRVGIGTTAPAFDLDVTGNIRAGTELYKGSIALGATGNSNTTSGAATLGAYDEFTFSNSKTIQGVLKDFDTAMGGFGAGTSDIWIDGGTFTYVSGNKILGNIAVGGTAKITGIYLGDTAPIVFGANNNFDLKLSGSSLVLSDLTNTFLSIGDSGTTGNFNFNNNQMYLRGDGRLGLGTTAPGYTLDVAGNIRAGTEIYKGSIALGTSGTSTTTSGASVIGVYDNLDNGSSAMLQDVLRNLDLAIGNRDYSNNYLSDTTSISSALTTLDTQLYNLSIGVSGMWRDTNGATAGGTAYLNDLTSAMAIGGTGAGSPFYFAPTSGMTINNGTNTLFNLNNTLGSSTDLLSLNIPSGSVISNIFAIYDNGSPVFKVSQSQIESAVPHTFTAAGDVSMAYDLNFTNAAAAYINFEGPGYIRTNSPSGNYNLTLAAANTGVVYVDDSLVVTAGNIIGGTYAGLGVTAPNGGMLIQGLVGIGTTAPAYNLDVTGNIRAGTELYKGSIALGATGNSNVTSGAATLGAYDEFTYSSSKTIQGVLKDFDTAMGSLGGGTGASFWSSGPGYIHSGTFPLGNIASGGTNKITGIYLGDTAPIYFGSDNDFGIAYGFGSLNIGTSSNPYLSIGNSVNTGNFNFNQNQMYLRGDGKLGLGTTAPTYMFDIVSSDVSGLMKLTGNSITSGTAVALTLDGLTTGTGFDMSLDGLTTGTGFKINSTSTALTTGQLMGLDWSPSGSSEIFATGDLFKINIGSLGNIGNLFAIYDDGNDVFKVSQSQITSAVPHAFTAAGDVSISNDLIFTDQVAAFIRSDGPLTLQSGEAYENLDLTLRPSGTGAVVVDDGNDFKLFGGQKLILDGDDNGDSYLLWNSTTPTNRISMWVDGVESMRWRAGAASGTAPLVEANGSVISSAFDLAEIYPTNDGKLEAGDIVVVSKNAQEAGASYLVEKSTNENKSNVVGIVSTKPGLLMGGSSFYSDFCSLATSGPDGEEKARAQARGEATAQQKALEANFNDTGETPVNSDAINEAVEDKINSCKALRQVPVALSGRVPVKIDLSAGDIKAGDLLAISESQPGKAVKATKEGWVVGRALQDYHQGDTTVMMFVNLQYYTGKDFSVDTISKSIDTLTATQQQISDVLEVEKGTNVDKINMYGDLNLFGSATVNELTSLSKINTGLLTLNGNDNSINVVGGATLKIQNNLSAGDVDFFNGGLVMTSEGSLIAKGDIEAKKVVAEEFAVKGASTLNKNNTDLSSKKDATIGEGTIKAGTTEISIQNLQVTPGVKIFVTANTDTDGQALIVKEKKEGSFKVSLKKALLTDVKFDYWVVKVE